MCANTFVDTNVLLYMLSDDPRKASTVEQLLKRRPTISVQVLNEVVSVATRKLRMPLPEVLELCQAVRRLCYVEPITPDHHDLALSLMLRYHFGIYDSLIVASALIAGCHKLCTQDLQHGQVIMKQLKVENPF
jgi:predicted nucleic acid-binding protein